MTIRNISLTTFLALLFWSCSNKFHSVSKVEYFQYGGYNDTICALIDGNIYERDSSNSPNNRLRPLQNVKIKIEQNNKSVLTDTAGHFLIGAEKGSFSLLVTKDGYQELRLTNYISDPDQVSKAKIILAKGTRPQTYKIADRKK